MDGVVCECDVNERWIRKAFSHMMSFYADGRV